MRQLEVKNDLEGLYRSSLKKKYAYFTKNNFTSVFKTLWDMCTPNLNQIEPASDAWDISTPSRKNEKATSGDSFRPISVL